MLNNSSQIDFAKQLEEDILAELTVQLDKCPESLRQVLTELVTFQSKAKLLLDQVSQTNKTLSDVEFQIAPNEAVWQKKVDIYSDAIGEDEITKHYIPLWTMVTVFNQSAAFYRQFAANTANPSMRMALLSIAELKKLAARRAESVLRVCINRTWKQLGFCPFSWN